jgi:hypothetical protein
LRIVNTYAIFNNFRIVYTGLAKMRLNVLLSFCSAFLLLSALGLSTTAPKAGDTTEYLRLLAGIKYGNLTFKGNMSASKLWVYTSQGLKFEEKLKERKIEGVGFKHNKT